MNPDELSSVKGKIKSLFKGKTKELDEAAKAKIAIHDADALRENLEDVKRRMGLASNEEKPRYHPNPTVNELHEKVHNLNDEVEGLKDVAKRNSDRSRSALRLGTYGAGAAGLTGYVMGKNSNKQQQNYEYHLAEMTDDEIESLAEEIVDDIIKEAMTPDQRTDSFIRESLASVNESLIYEEIDEFVNKLASEITDEIIKEAMDSKGVGKQVLLDGKELGIIAAADLASIAGAKKIWGTEGGEPAEADPARVTAIKKTDEATNKPVVAKPKTPSVADGNLK